MLPLHLRAPSVRSAALAVALVAVVALLPPAVLAADASCPLIDAGAVSQSVGTPVKGGLLLDPITQTPLDTGPDLTVCIFDSDADSTIAVSRQLNAFSPGGDADPMAMALRMLRVTSDARSELQAMHDAGE